MEENDEPSGYDYLMNKRTDRVYVSKSLGEKVFNINQDTREIYETIRPFRLISKVFDLNEDHHFIKDGNEVVLRVTPGSKQEIRAKFYEDSREINTLTIQKYTTATGSPHAVSFTFQKDEIATLFNFIRNIGLIPVKDTSSQKLDDNILEEIVLSKEQAIEVLNNNPELLQEIIKNNITAEEVVNLSYRKEQLKIFEKLLVHNEFFETYKTENKIKLGVEAVWQHFFENNTWIFGYGLSYVFNSPLDDIKLEQVIAGFTFNSAGKRIDALMKTKGIISSFCFGEIKTHSANLLKQVKDPYRGECWAISDELAGAIAQTQKSVQRTIKEVSTKIEVKEKSGALTGEQVFLYQPKSFVIIGSLSEFDVKFGVNEDKFSSFELFRQNQINPEIITFDELFERAKYIVKSNEK